MRTSVTIADVTIAPVPSDLLGFRLDQPTTGALCRTHAILFEGWVLPSDGPPVAIELWERSGYRERIPMGIRRPDLAEAHPGVPHARSRIGFRVEASALGLPPRFELGVDAVIQDDRRVRLATVRGSRTRLPADSSLSPLLVTSLGRTGTTWMMTLLSRHPQIIAHDVWDGETKVASYWAEIFSMLGRPGSYLQAIRSDRRGGQWYVGTSRLYDQRVEDDALHEWLGTAQVEAAAEFCRERVQEFYARECRLQPEKTPRYFVEKSLPRSPAYADVLAELFPEVREIFLVRDFRDMLSSIFAYNARLNALSFNRGLASTDEQYVREFLGRDLKVLLRGWRQRAANAHLVRYEDLALKTHQTLNGLLAYLGLADGPDVIAAMLAEPEEKSAKQQRHKTSTTLADSIGRWKNDLDPSLVPVCHDAFGEALAEFGYSTTTA